MIDALVYYVLKNNSTIAGKVSTRIYPIQVPQNAATPFIQYQKIGSYDRVLPHSGAGHVATSIFRISAFGTTALEAKEIAAAVVAQFQGYSGAVGSDKVYIARVSGEMDLFEDDLGDFRVAVDVDLTHSE